MFELLLVSVGLFLYVVLVVFVVLVMFGVVFFVSCWCLVS